MGWRWAFLPWVLRHLLQPFRPSLHGLTNFVRMAQYSRANIKIVGSHAGISIGPDGPSQMGLEDIPIFLSMPEAVVLYPSDAVSTEFLVRKMSRHKGISYLRTTRGMRYN